MHRIYCVAVVSAAPLQQSYKMDEGCGKDGGALENKQEKGKATIN
jgi:hypothetical protein